MINANENTVSSKNQLPVSSSIYYLGCEDAPKRLLIVGNSITRHAPSAKLGWFGDWGMAASTKENDFVHVLEKMLEELKEYCEKLKVVGNFSAREKV